MDLWLNKIIIMSFFADSIPGYRDRNDKANKKHYAFYRWKV